jgi:hypothetical protein
MLPAYFLPPMMNDGVSLMPRFSASAPLALMFG